MCKFVLSAVRSSASQDTGHGSQPLLCLAACVAAGEERWCRRSLPNLNTRSVRPTHPLSVWSLQFKVIRDKILGDTAIELDRIVSNAYKIILSGDSLRPKQLED